MNYILTLNDNKKRFFFLQLMKQLDFIEDIKEVKLSANQLQFINDFEESIKYLKLADYVFVGGAFAISFFSSSYASAHSSACFAVLLSVKDDITSNSFSMNS